MTSKQKIILTSVIVAVLVVLLALGGYFIAVYSSASGARTSGGFTYEVSGKTVTITSYSGSDTTVTVPAKIGGRRVAKIAAGAFSSSKATSLVFDDDISQIELEEECFKGQTTLTYVKLPSSLKEIPDSCFEDCTALEHIVIPSGVTTIGDSAFEGCSVLSYTGNDSQNKIVTLPEQLTSLGTSAFKDCKKITAVIFGSKLQLVSQSAFENCTMLVRIDFGSESAVTRIADKAFYNTSLNRNTASSSSSEALKLPSTLATIGNYAFANNTSSSFTKIEIPSNTVQIGDYAFSGCKYLKTVTFAEESGLKKLGEGVFMDCERLTSAALPDTITDIPALAFKGCKRLVSFEIGANVETIGSGAFGGVGNYDDTSAISFTVAEENDNFTIVELDKYYLFGSDNTSTAKSHYLLMSADKSKLYAYIGKYDSSDCGNDQTNKSANSFNFLRAADISKNLREIDGYAFCGLNADKLCIPITVTKIGEAFISGSSVKGLYFEGGDCTFDEDVFDGVSGILTVYGFKQGTIKDFIDDLNDAGENDIRFEDGYSWPL